MKESSNILNPDLIYDLYTGGMKPQIIRIALLLDVFTPLADGPADARVVAAKCGCDETGVARLLDYLSTLDVVIKRESNFALTETAAAFLVPTSPSYAGDWLFLQTGFEMWEGILNTLRGGQGDYPTTPWAQDAWLESYLQMRIPRSLEMWAAAGFEPGKYSGLHILDLACGCAIKSFTLAQVDETVQVTCVDSSEVLDVAHNLAVRMGLLQRVTFQPGDIHTLDPGVETYGAALLGQISYILTLEQNLDLFYRIHKALLPEGVLVIDAAMSAEPLTETSSLMSLILWGVYGGSAHSFEDYKKLLNKAGFRKVTQHSDWWLTAIKI